MPHISRLDGTRRTVVVKVSAIGASTSNTMGRMQFNFPPPQLTTTMQHLQDWLFKYASNLFHYFIEHDHGWVPIPKIKSTHSQTLIQTKFAFEEGSIGITHELSHEQSLPQCIELCVEAHYCYVMTSLIHNIMLCGPKESILSNLCRGRELSHTSYQVTVNSLK